jgi:hypothetical protein
MTLTQRIGDTFAGLPDTRGKSNNQQYEMADAALSASIDPVPALR